MPFETVAISSYGHLVPCCAFGMEKPLFNYIENPITIKEYFKSSELKNVQDKFLAGNIPIYLYTQLIIPKFVFIPKNFNIFNTIVVC